MIDAATPNELKAAREALGLSPAEAAKMLDMESPKSIYRMESDPKNKTHREPSARVVRLYCAYLSGHRPPDWPAHLIEDDARREAARETLAEVRT